MQEELIAHQRVKDEEKLKMREELEDACEFQRQAEAKVADLTEDVRRWQQIAEREKQERRKEGERAVELESALRDARSAMLPCSLIPQKCCCKQSQTVTQSCQTVADAMELSASAYPRERHDRNESNASAVEGVVSGLGASAGASVNSVHPDRHDVKGKCKGQGENQPGKAMDSETKADGTTDAVGEEMCKDVHEDVECCRNEVGWKHQACQQAQQLLSELALAVEDCGLVRTIGRMRQPEERFAASQGDEDATLAERTRPVQSEMDVPQAPGIASQHAHVMEAWAEVQAGSEEGAVTNELNRAKETASKLALVNRELILEIQRLRVIR